MGNKEDIILIDATTIYWVLPKYKELPSIILAFTSNRCIYKEDHV
jgi:hypothetical protein